MMNLKHYIFIVLSLVSFVCFSQTRVAILDFENTSGIAKYDGFGKAMSNMLITDLKNSIHPRKVTFLERSQLNKILEEQGLQKSKKFDNKTAVNFGKLAGVKYVLVGSVYVLDGVCNLTSRLVDVETSEIVHAKESNGQIKEWLKLKTVLAEELSQSLNNPIVIKEQFTNAAVTEGTISQYSKVISKMDKGDTEGAQQMAEMLTEIQPDFKYFEEVQADIELLKAEVEELKEKVVEAVEDPLQVAFDFWDRKEYEKSMLYIEMEEGRLLESDEYFENKKLFLKFIKSRLIGFLGDVNRAMEMQRQILDKYPFFVECRAELLKNLASINSTEEIIKNQLNFFISNRGSFGSEKIADASIYIHEYIGNGVSDEYSFAYGYFGAMDKQMNKGFYSELLSDIGSEYMEIGKFDVGMKYVKGGLLEMEKIETRNSNYEKVKVYDYILTNATWYCAKYKKLEEGTNLFNQYGVSTGSVMSVVNFGHIYLLGGDEKKAQDLYCWAIQHETNENKNLNELIRTDWEDLAIVSKPDLSCENAIVITEQDKQVDRLAALLTSKSVYSSDGNEWQLTFSGNSKCELKLNERYSESNDGVNKISAKLTIVDNYSLWIRLEFEQEMFLPFGSYNSKYYTFKLSENGENLQELNENEIIFKKNH